MIQLECATTEKDQKNIIPMEEWISVKDSLPNDDEKVIILLDGNDIETATFIRGRDRKDIKSSSSVTQADQYGYNTVRYAWDIGAIALYGQRVSFWMHLPKLPIIKD